MNFNLNWLMLVFAFSVALLSVEGMYFASVVWVVVSFFLMNNHASITLIQLELLGMVGIIGVCLISSTSSMGPIMIFVLMSIGVIEAALGLSLLSLLSRSLSSELMKMKI